MSNDTITKLVKNMMENRLFDLHTCTPGIIQSYDEKQHLAEVQPVLKRVLTTDEVLETPIVANVPVVFPRTSSFIMHYPINQGDRVLLVYAERSLDNYLSDGSTDPAIDGKKFDITDAIAIPGLFPFSEKSTVENNTDFVINFNEKTFSIGQSGRIEITDGQASFVIESGKVAVGTSATEVLNILSQTLEKLSTTTVNTAIGPQPLSTFADFIALQSQLDTIKGSV